VTGFIKRKFSHIFDPIGTVVTNLRDYFTTISSPAHLSAYADLAHLSASLA